VADDVLDFVYAFLEMCTRSLRLSVGVADDMLDFVYAFLEREYQCG